MNVADSPSCLFQQCLPSNEERRFPAELHANSSSALNDKYQKSNHKQKFFKKINT